MDAQPIPYACEVAIIGGGPVGVTLAHLLGRLGLNTIVFEREIELHLAPRAVGVDDMSLRTWRTCGLPDDLWPDMTPLGADGAGMVFYTNKERILAAWRPDGRTFRWPRGVTMVQPEVEARLRAGLAAHGTVRLLLGHEVTSVVQSEDGCRIEGRHRDRAFIATARFSVGCEGGRSLTRHAMGVRMPGREGRARWLIVDTVEKAAGRRSARDVEVMGCARRAVVSVPRKGGHRRWEFQVAANAPAGAPSDERIRSLIEMRGGAPAAEIRRALIYRFAMRHTQRYAWGRLALAGDSAHVMPPYAAQGLSCGLEDAANLHWRLWLMTRHGAAGSKLLADYSRERRAAVRRSLQLSAAMAVMVTPDGPVTQTIRDAVISAAMTLPSARNMLTRGDMRIFRRYRAGTFLPGGPGGHVLPHMQSICGEALDDRLGPRFTLLVNATGELPANKEILAFWQALNTTTLRITAEAAQGGLALSPPPAPWKRWLAPGRVLIVRPDRVVLAHGRVGDLPLLTRACACVLAVQPLLKAAE